MVCFFHKTCNMLGLFAPDCLVLFWVVKCLTSVQVYMESYTCKNVFFEVIFKKRNSGILEYMFIHQYVQWLISYFHNISIIHIISIISVIQFPVFVNTEHCTKILNNLFETTMSFHTQCQKYLNKLPTQNMEVFNIRSFQCCFSWIFTFNANMNSKQKW